MKKATKEEARRVLSVPFALTRTVRVPEAGLRRVRVGEYEGREAWTFDLSINLHHTADGDSTANNYSAAVVQLPSRSGGRVALARKGILRRAEKAGAPEVEAGTEELRDKFTVRATSEEAAREVLDERVCAWLAGPGSNYHYEIAGDRVLAYGWRRWLGGDGPLKAATGLADQLALQESREPVRI